MSFFKRIATPLIQRGIPVIPVNPGEKKCTLEKWQDRAQLGPAMIDFWDEENPAYNVGCVAYTAPGGICILDCDVKGLAKRIVAKACALVHVRTKHANRTIAHATAIHSESCTAPHAGVVCVCASSSVIRSVRYAVTRQQKRLTT